MWSWGFYIEGAARYVDPAYSFDFIVFNSEH